MSTDELLTEIRGELQAIREVLDSMLGLLALRD